MKAHQCSFNDEGRQARVSSGDNRAFTQERSRKTRDWVGNKIPHSLSGAYESFGRLDKYRSNPIGDKPPGYNVKRP